VTDQNRAAERIRTIAERYVSGEFVSYEDMLLLARAVLSVEEALDDPLCDGWTVARIREAMEKP
jgi:hypothetical protein